MSKANRNIVVSALRALVLKQFDQLVKAGDVDDLIRDLTIDVLNRVEAGVASSEGSVFDDLDSRAAPRAMQREDSREINTRTSAGREVYDNDVMAALGQDAQTAAQIRKVAGGTALQVRTALARLAKAGRVRTSGQARGTRYQAI